LENKHVQLYSELEVYKSSNDSRFVPCRILVCHDQDNLNGSWFDSEKQMKCAEKSIRGIPLLAHVYKNENDEWVLGGHDGRLEMTDTTDGFDMEYVYLEKAYGFVPEDTIITQVEKNGKKYLSCTGLIWREYSGQLLKVLDSNDGALEVSMEIEVNDCDFRDDGYIEISDFTFLGITMLGVGVQPAMEGANLSVFTVGDIKTELEEMKKIYSLEKGGEVMDNKLENQKDNFEVEEDKDDFTPEENKEECSQDNNEENKIEDVENNSVEESKEDEKYSQLQKDYQDLQEKYSELETKYNESQAKLESMSDYEELKQFKEESDSKQFELEINEISEKYALDTEGSKVLKDKVLKHEISKEEYEGKLAIMWANEIRESQVFNKPKDKKENQIGISNPNEKYSDSKAPYGGRLEKWRTKK
jgi:hypothetical protein